MTPKPSYQLAIQGNSFYIHSDQLQIDNFPYFSYSALPNCIINILNVMQTGLPAKTTLPVLLYNKLAL